MSCKQAALDFYDFKTKIESLQKRTSTLLAYFQQFGNDDIRLGPVARMTHKPSYQKNILSEDDYKLYYEEDESAGIKLDLLENDVSKQLFDGHSTKQNRRQLML